METPGNSPGNSLSYFRWPILANTLVLFSTRFPYLEITCKFSDIFSLSSRTHWDHQRQGTGMAQLFVEAKPRLENLLGLKPDRKRDSPGTKRSIT